MKKTVAKKITRKLPEKYRKRSRIKKESTGKVPERHRYKKRKYRKLLCAKQNVRDRQFLFPKSPIHLFRDNLRPPRNDKFLVV